MCPDAHTLGKPLAYPHAFPYVHIPGISHVFTICTSTVARPMGHHCVGAVRHPILHLHSHRWSAPVAMPDAWVGWGSVVDRWMRVGVRRLVAAGRCRSLTSPGLSRNLGYCQTATCHRKRSVSGMSRRMALPVTDRVRTPVPDRRGNCPLGDPEVWRARSRLRLARAGPAGGGAATAAGAGDTSGGVGPAAPAGLRPMTVSCRSRQRSCSRW